MTREEFLKKYEENYDEKMYRFRSSEETRRKQTYTNNVLAKIVGKIETADLDMCYELEEEETKNLFDYYFEDKIEEIKQKYDFLEINVVRNLVGLGFIGNRTVGGEVEKVEWNVKEEETCKYD
jgi:hypothetical protein